MSRPPGEEQPREEQPREEQPRGSTAPARLIRLGFVDSRQAERDLQAVGLLRGGEPTDAAALEVLEALAEAPDPDLAVQTLARLVAVQPHPAQQPEQLLDRLREHPGLRARLFAVLGTSRALGEHLVGHPRDWTVLTDDAVTQARPSLFGLQRQLLQAVGAPTDQALPWGTGGVRAVGADPTVVARLRAAYRRCLVDLAARDLSGSIAVEDVAGELADLASATLSAALAVALAALPADAAPCRLAVIGMGKAGGRELNYVSDVDVVFVCEPVDGGPEGPALASGTALARAMIRICGEVAWPVDAALRPEGNAGPLVRTLASHQAYYARWAGTWEFQALLKARPLAGDLLLGQAYTGALSPLVWAASGREGFVSDVQQMRRRVEKTLGPQGDREVKLGPGGLRDIEFAVQLLQLVHGRTDSTVRSGTTLTALDQLAAGGYVGREDARHLAEAYRWLRTVEHRLQLRQLRRTHLLPAADDEVALRWLARACGYRGEVLPLFARERAGFGYEVRRLHEKLFYRPLLAAVARLPAEEARLTPAAARVRLASLGFRDPTSALRHIEALTEGLSRRAAIQQTLLPAMLGWFAGAADPDAGLLSFRQVSDALGTTPWFLRLLRDEGAVAERLAGLLASSRFVADLLARAPEGVRLLANDEELQPRSRAALEQSFVAVGSRREDAEPAVAAVRGLRRQELFRTATAELLGLLDSPGRALSDIAAATVAAALAVATRKVEAEQGGPLPVRLAVIAMGRLGGGEQGYGSDADVLFVHQAMPGVAEDVAASSAHNVAYETCRLLALPAPDAPLAIDADLRPEGKQGPLTRSLESYRSYYARWSLVWESQALLRASFLAGDREVGEQFLLDIEPVRYPPAGLTQEQVTEVRRIKARVERERLPRGSDPGLELKLGRGGLADVEWTIQLLQLQHGHAVAGLRTPSTLPALAAAVEAGLLEPADGALLAATWRLTTRVRDALVLVRGRPTSALPSAGRDLAGVARVLGYPADASGAFLDDYRRATRRARAVVERVFYP